MEFLRCETIFSDRTFASAVTEVIEHNKSEKVGCIKFNFSPRRDGENKKTVSRLIAISIYLNGQKQVIIVYLKGKSLVNNRQSKGQQLEYIYSEGNYPVACRILCNYISHDIEEVQIKVDFLQFVSELQRINQEIIT